MTLLRILSIAALLLLQVAPSCGTSRSAAQVAATPAPAGVDPALWRELTRELERQLNGGTGARAGVADRITGEGAGATKSASALTQPAQLEYDQGSATLSWYVVHPGDYNLDGLVTVADLTPLGAHFGEVASAIFGTPLFPHHSIHSAVDGDNNGEINIADVTPIAVNFGGRLEGYRIYRSADPLDNPADPQQPNGAGSQLVATLGLATATQAFEERKKMSAQVVPTSITQHYWVRPFVGFSDGAASASVEVKAVSNFPPVAQLSAPTEGSTPAQITFDASESFDADGQIVKYEWDFDGDGEFEYDSGAAAVVDYYYYAPGTFTTTVRVTDNGGASATKSATVEIAEAAKWHETLVDSNDSGFSQARSPVVTSGENTILMYERNFALIVLASQDMGSTWTEAHSIANVLRVNWTGLWNGRPIALVRGNVDHYLLHRALSEAADAWATPIGAFPPGLWNECFGYASGPELRFLESNNGNALTAAINMSNGAWSPLLEFDIPFGSVTVESTALIGGLTAFIEVRNGRDLMLWSGADQDIQSWDIPLPVGNTEIAAAPRLLELEGNPALFYFDSTAGKLLYVRSTDRGATWNSPIVIAQKSSGGHFDVLMIDGRPCVFMMNRITRALEFTWSNDIHGRLWTPIQFVAAPGINVEGYQQPDLGVADVFGHPACSIDGQLESGERVMLFYVYK